MRILEGIFFLSLATTAHIGAFWISPQQTNTASDNTLAAKIIKLESASVEQVTLLQAWEKNPGIPLQTPKMFSLKINHDLLPEPNQSLSQSDERPPMNFPIITQDLSIYHSTIPTLEYTKPLSVNVKLSSPELKPPKSHAITNQNLAPLVKILSAKPLIRILNQKILIPSALPELAVQQVQSPPTFTPSTSAAAGTAQLADKKKSSKTLNGGTNALRAKWGAEIYKKVSQTMRYPRYSKDSGTVTLYILLATTGKLLNVEIMRSSGSPSLNDAALKAVRRAGSFAKAPKGLHDRSYQFKLSLHFNR
jgi:protein TonB